jgi:xanthine dehydrogenase molybdopterin-binding subunit B
MEKIEINPGHYLELMDRIHIVMMNVQDHLLEHPLTQKYKDIEKQIEDAQHKLLKAYQLVGQKDYENENENNTY